MDNRSSAIDCTLYYFPFSLYSIMVRFTAALGAKSGEATTPIHVEHQLVNLHRDENIAESYLLSINPKGQVRIVVNSGERG
jgi:hypothetical protein